MKKKVREQVMERLLNEHDNPRWSAVQSMHLWDWPRLRQRLMSVQMQQIKDDLKALEIDRNTGLTNQERQQYILDQMVQWETLNVLDVHNAGHWMFTEHTVGRAISRNRFANREVLFCIANILEDVRVNKLLYDKFPEFNPESVLKYCEQVERDQFGGDDQLPALFQFGNILYLRLEGFEIYPQYDKTIIQFVDDVVMRVANKLDKCQSTKDVYELAVEIYNLIFGKKVVADLTGLTGEPAPPPAWAL